MPCMLAAKGQAGFNFSLTQNKQYGCGLTLYITRTAPKFWRVATDHSHALNFTAWLDMQFHHQLDGTVQQRKESTSCYVCCPP